MWNIVANGEVVDSFESYDEARKMVTEYKLAYGPKFTIDIKKEVNKSSSFNETIN
jgi:hypothetical protein